MTFCRRLARTTALANLVLLCLLGCAARVERGSHCTVDPGFLAGEQQFAWSSLGPVDLIDESGYISPAIVEQLKDRVVLEMQNKGFELVTRDQSSNPAMLELQLYLRARRELHSTGPQGSTGPCTYPNCWQAPNNANVQFTTHTVGFLAADLYYEGKPIWRGWVERMLYPSERDNAMNVLNEAVPLLFENFPP